ncbi:hypothetical protein F5Y19DRAFT_7117 [Xylariaceae sp. FL1651]|nr:hypothetical protein F5Y19DRAFT_7117 [Xylariaceae sp. FL1651]
MCFQTLKPIESRDKTRVVRRGPSSWQFPDSRNGKSTWATSLVIILNEHHHLKTIIVSLDDLYHTHKQLVRLRENNPQNALFRNRGQPGTHDEVLTERSFKDLGNERELPMPGFDKSRFNGEGIRVPEMDCE